MVVVNTSLLQLIGTEWRQAKQGNQAGRQAGSYSALGT